jgi:hypothetical protein
MTPFVTCGKCREELCALMSGDLPAAESMAAEKHLAGCIDCQRYKTEMRNVTVPLSAWDEFLPEIGPTEAARMRWGREFDAALEPDDSAAMKVLRRVLEWSRSVVSPCRRIWAGMATAWVLIIALNIARQVEEKSQATRPPPPGMIRALLAREGLLSALRPADVNRNGGPEERRILGRDGGALPGRRCD